MTEIFLSLNKKFHNIDLLKSVSIQIYIFEYLKYKKGIAIVSKLVSSKQQSIWTMTHQVSFTPGGPAYYGVEIPVHWASIY